MYLIHVQMEVLCPVRHVKRLVRQQSIKLVMIYVVGMHLQLDTEVFLITVLWEDQYVALLGQIIGVMAEVIYTEEVAVARGQSLVPAQQIVLIQQRQRQHQHMIVHIQQVVLVEVIYHLIVQAITQIHGSKTCTLPY